MAGLRVRNEQEKENMRSMILEAATKFILSEGYENLSMRKLASAIGYSPTTIYIYYKDKKEIIADISKKLYENMFAQLRAYLEEHAHEPVAQRLTSSFKIFVRAMVSHPDMGQALWRSAVNPLSALNEIQKQEGNAMALLREMLEEGQGQGIFRALSNDAAWMLQTSLMGFTSFSVMNGIYRQDNWEALLEEYVGILLKGVRIDS